MSELNNTGMVYKITNKVNGKAYIGATTKSFDQRYPGGRWYAYTHIKELQDDAFTYGKSNFEVEILKTNICPDDLLQIEQDYVVIHGTFYPNGYNSHDVQWDFSEALNKLQRSALRSAIYHHLRSGAVSLELGLKLIRLMFGCNQEQFAEKQGVSLSALRRIEQGVGSTNIDTLQRLLSGTNLGIAITSDEQINVSEKKWMYLKTKRTHSSS